MKEVLEDALVIYRQDGESLLLIVAPALVLGPVLAFIASSGPAAALIAGPLLALLYIAVYAVTTQAGGYILSNQEPDPGATYIAALRRLTPALRALLAPLLLIGALAALGSALSDGGQPELAIGIGALGGAALLQWAGRYCLELPLLLSHEISYDSARDASAELLPSTVTRQRLLLAAATAPLAIAALVCWGLGAAVKPAFGGALFAAAAALWLPFLALVVSGACERFLVDATAQPPVEAAPARNW